MTGRKLCTSPLHAGPRWLLSIEFYAREWNHDKTVALSLSSHCRTCVRLKQRASKGIAKNGVPYQPATLDGSRHYYGKRLYAPQRNSRRRARYKDKKDPRLPVEPFRHWLNQVVMENSIMGVARNVGISDRRVSTFVSGHYFKRVPSGELKRYEIKHVRLSVVDRFCTSFGIHVSTIYHPDMVNNYRVPVLSDDRHRKHRNHETR